MTEELHHEVDGDGHYCETSCKACVADQRFCKICETYYGAWQRHSGWQCNERMKILIARQLCFPFFK